MDSRDSFLYYRGRHEESNYRSLMGAAGCGNSGSGGGTVVVGMKEENSR